MASLRRLYILQSLHVLAAKLRCSDSFPVWCSSSPQHILVVEDQLRASKEEMETCLGQYDELFRTIQRLSEELKVQMAANAGVQVSPSFALLIELNN